MKYPGERDLRPSKLALLAILLLASCSSQPPFTPSSVRFQFLPWTPGQDVSVCWEFETQHSITFRQRIQSQVESILQDVSLDLVGWDKCTSNYTDVRILIYDDQFDEEDPRFMTILEDLARTTETPGHPRIMWQIGSISDIPLPSEIFVVLNTNMVKAEPEAVQIYKSLSTQGRKNLVLSTSIHEFGHVLGLRHEDAHPNSLCDQFREDLHGDVVVSDYNPFSFMSRCFYRQFNYELGPILPNQLDLDALALTYQPEP